MRRYLLFLGLWVGAGSGTAPAAEPPDPYYPDPAQSDKPSPGKQPPEVLQEKGFQPPEEMERRKFPALQGPGKGRRPWARRMTGRGKAENPRDTLDPAVIEAEPVVLRDSLNFLNIASSGRDLWAVTEQGGIYHSPDGGAGWERQQPSLYYGLQLTAPILRRVLFADPRNGFLAGDQGNFMVTRDGGRQWDSRRVSEDPPDFRSMTVLDSDHVELVGSDATRYITEDGGDSWREARDINPVSLVSQSLGKGGATYYAGSAGAFYIREKGGDKWQYRPVPGAVDLYAVHFIDSTRGMVAGSHGFMARTSDAGVSWKVMALGVPEKILALDFRNEKNGFAAGEKGLLYETRDGGLSWVRASRKPGEGGNSAYLRFPPPGYFLSLLLIAGLLLPALRTRPLEQVKESIADQLVSDKPLESDGLDVLGLARRADALAAFLSNPRTEPPITFGILGEWGRGKSSLMNLLRARLSRESFNPVWFNAWHHQSEENLLASLLETIRRTRVAPWWTLDGLRFRWNLTLIRMLRDRQNDWVLLLTGLVVFLVLCRWNPLHLEWSLASVKALVDDGVENTRWMTRMMEGGTLLMTALPLGVSLLTFGRIARKVLVVFQAKPARLLAGLAGKSSLQDMSGKIGFREEFRREFGEVAEALKHAPLIIFIDDLDRCEPVKVMEILEAINFLVTCGPCYFVVAMDKRQITRAIIVHNEKEIQLFQEGGEAHAQEYLEKIINIEVSVPEPDAEAYRRLMTIRQVHKAAASGSRGYEVVKNLPVYLLLGFLLYTSGALLRAPSEDTAGMGASGDSAAVIQATPAATSPAPAPPVLAGNLPRFPFAWDNGAPVFRPQDQAPWSRPFAVAVPVLAGGFFLWACLAWFFQKRRKVFMDSSEFLKAVDDWYPLIFLGAKTPRSVKKFLNRMRFLAVLRRNAPLPGLGGRDMGDGELVALASVELGMRALLDGQPITRENLEKFAGLLRTKYGASPVVDRVEELCKGGDMNRLMHQFEFLGANVRVNA
jgi:photosystem II stability/assembly factor-like uncharacterized protein